VVCVNACQSAGSEGAGVWNKRSVPEVAAMGGFALQLVRGKLPMDPHERPVVTDDNKVAGRALPETMSVTCSSLVPPW
jgi:hypothetical protein